MAVTFAESNLGVRIRTDGPVEEIERRYFGRADAGEDEFQVRAAAESDLPAFENGRPRRGIEVEQVDEGSGMWAVSAIYRGGGAAEPPQAGDSTYEFDTTGGTAHVTQSHQTVGKFAATGYSPAPDFRGAIGVTEDGVAGVDVTVPTYSWSERHYLSPAQVGPTFRANAYALTGKFNSSPFRGFQAGEVLFLGVQGSFRESLGVWELTFRFSASPNVADLQIGGALTGITVPQKLGWDYLWVYYHRIEDTSAKRVILVPVAAYVERVYHPGNFLLLGIGT